MINIHFISNLESIYTRNFIRFIGENFESSENVIFVYHPNLSNRIKEEYSVYRNVKIYNNFLLLAIRKYLNILKADKIIIHQLNIPQLMAFWLFFYPAIFNKLLWVIWGSDLYDYQLQSKKLKSRLIEICRKSFIKRVKYISSYIYGDFKLCQQVYNTKAKYFKSWYPYTVNDKVKSMPLIKKKFNSRINVMLGNSGDPSNNYFNLVDKIEKFKDENIMFHFMLSYGAKEDFISELKSYAESKLNNKFAFITKSLDFEDYIDFINSIDICIFNHNRQQGLGNINLLLCLGKKIFIRSVTTPFEHYASSGIKIFDTDSIESFSFVEFCQFEEKHRVLNKEKILVELDIKTIKKDWLKILYDNW